MFDKLLPAGSVNTKEFSVKLSSFNIWLIPRERKKMNDKEIHKVMINLFSF